MTNALEAIMAAVMFMAEPKSGPAWPRPILRAIATTPKQEAERSG